VSGHSRTTAETGLAIAGEAASGQDAIAKLQDWSSMARGAFSQNTIRAWKADWEVFTMSCRVFRLESLPAAPKTVRAFVFECLGKGKKPATVRRYVSTIGRAHRASGLKDPTASEDVKLALKEMGRNTTGRQKQARGLTWAEIEVFLSIEPRNLRDIRDRALVAVAYDTMCRREELVSLGLSDIAQVADGSGSILIRRSKTDTTGEGATAYLSPLTMRLLNQWITEAGIKEGRYDICEGVRAIRRWHIAHASECDDHP
jgi:integrase